ncbi:superoxide dismutase [Paenibacillus xerothermodurans]
MHGVGHYLHTLFWLSMGPQGGGEATGTIAADITSSFGSFEVFQSLFTAAANSVEGAGWVVMAWSPLNNQLEIVHADKNNHLSAWPVIPLLVLDMWEHAYYLQYKNNRRDYIDAWWHTVDWQQVNERLSQARSTNWPSL